MKPQRIRQLYRFFCSIKLTVVLLLVLVADLCLGYLSLQGNVELFQPLNEVGLRQWLLTYGRTKPLSSAWFFLLLPLLGLLVVNTLCCTGDKLYHLFHSSAGKRSSNRFYLVLSIHLMHLAIVVLLIGYLTSYTLSSIHPATTLMPGVVVKVPDTTVTAELLDMQMIAYSGERLASFFGRNLNTRAQLLLSDGKKKKTATISVNQPAHFQGFSFFLQRFNPTSATGMSSSKYIIVDIRRDPGVIPTFSGMAAFVTGLLGYLFFRYQSRRDRSLVT